MAKSVLPRVIRRDVRCGAFDGPSAITTPHCRGDDHEPRTVALNRPDAAQIYVRLTDILRDVFDIDDLEATPTLDASQVEGWDSMGNVQLFLAIEQAFGVRFGAGEIGDIHNVGELVSAISGKL